MGDYIEKEHAVEVNPKINPVWYLPHHPVVHSLKPEKVRAVYDCAAKHKHVSLKRTIITRSRQENRLVDVLNRFRQEPVGLLADIHRGDVPLSLGSTE